MSCMICVDKFCAYKVPIFSSFSCEELEEVFKIVKHRDVKKGEVLLQEGDTVTSFFILNEGRLKLYNYTKDGKEQILNLLQDGDSFGELHLLKEKNFEGYAKAITDCNISMIDKEEFQALLYKNPRMSLKVLEVVGERLEHLEKLALILADKDGDVKLAYVLVDFAKKYGKEVGGKISIQLPITKEEMASYAGLTRETLSRKLKAFSEEGLIHMVGHKEIEILKLDTLKTYF